MIKRHELRPLAVFGEKASVVVKERAVIAVFQPLDAAHRHDAAEISNRFQLAPGLAVERVLPRAVRLIGVDDRGKVKLSMKRVNQDTGEVGELPDPSEMRERSGGDRGRGGRDRGPRREARG